MNHTENLNLPQWEASDRIMRTDFNDAMESIDEACGGYGNCKIVTGSYVGTGEHGEAHPCCLTFPFKPQIVFILAANPASSTGLVSVSGDLLFLRPWAKTYGRSSNSTYYQVIIWGDHSVTWHCSSTSSGSPSQQANTAGTTYYYIAIG